MTLALAPPLGAASPTWRVTAHVAVARAGLLSIAPNGLLAAVVSQSARPEVLWLSTVTGRITGHVPLPAVPTAAVFTTSGSALAVTYGDCAFGPVPCGEATHTTLLRAGGGIEASVTTGAGSGALAAVPDSADVLVAADGAGVVDVLDTASARVVAAIEVGSGILASLAVAPGGREAAVANVTAGTVTLLDLADDRAAAVANVSEEAGAMAFDRTFPYLFVGQAQGQDVDVVHTPGGAVVRAVDAAQDVGPLVDLAGEDVLAAGSLTAQTVALFAVSSDGMLSYGAKRVVSVGAAAAGRITALAVADDGQELLAAAEQGVSVLAAPTFTSTERILPQTLGGPPTAMVAAQTHAVVLAGGRVDILSLVGGDK
jgi:DNA-binding beta-propeller fold protein YncE